MSKLIHVCPVDGERKHIVRGLQCWCKPTQDNGMVLHNDLASNSQLPPLSTDPISSQWDDRESAYVLAQMSATYALLLDRLGGDTIYPLKQVFD